MIVRTAQRSFPMPGENVNGDAIVVRVDTAGRALLAVIDGLGHGPRAAEAADAAVERLNTLELGQPIVDLMMSVHEALRETRGAAATLCVITDGVVEACAVGNVQLWCCPSTLPFMLSPGILGHRVPKLRACVGAVKVGSRIAVASDGISQRLRLQDFERLAPEEACDEIVRCHRKDNDDASVLLAQMEG